jgi:S1-C subfamily serine protease
MDKVFVSRDELSQVATSSEPAPFAPKLKPVIPWPARIAMWVLVLTLPFLCLVALVLRIAFRNQPSRTKLAWSSFCSTLLIVSGLLTSMGAVVALSLGPPPMFVSSALTTLDERQTFPQLPDPHGMSGADIAKKFKPLVLVVSPATRLWFTHRDVPAASFGAGVLLYADRNGYLIATARHVVGNGSVTSSVDKALVAGESGAWSNARVVAIHKRLDIALLWVQRESGSGDFVQPLSAPLDGRNVFVIGHPEGLKFTLSTGLVSRLDGTTVQISAPVSPGDSGGPVYDENGQLIGVVTAMIDKNANPNSENLNFAIRSDVILNENDWNQRANLAEHYKAFLQAVRKQQGQTQPQ